VLGSVRNAQLVRVFVKAFSTLGALVERHLRNLATNNHGSKATPVRAKVEEGRTGQASIGGVRVSQAVGGRHQLATVIRVHEEAFFALGTTV
jgi:hypothetical protein